MIKEPTGQLLVGLKGHHYAGSNSVEQTPAGSFL